MRESQCALRPRRHGETVIAQQLLEHRDCRSRIALLALSDRDAGLETLGRKAPLASAVRVHIDKRSAVHLIAHFGLGVAARSDAHASDQGRNRGDQEFS